MPQTSPQPATPEARALLGTAERDRVTVEVLLRYPDSPITSVCFHAQQYLEKVMKAVLVSHAVIFRRTHDLEELADLLEGQGLTLPASRNYLTRLNPFAVAFRYQEVDPLCPISVEPHEIAMVLDVTRVWVEGQLCD